MHTANQTNLRNIFAAGGSDGLLTAGILLFFSWLEDKYFGVPEFAQSQTKFALSPRGKMFSHTRHLYSEEWFKSAHPWQEGRLKGAHSACLSWPAEIGLTLPFSVSLNEGKRETAGWPLVWPY